MSTPNDRSDLDSRVRLDPAAFHTKRTDCRACGEAKLVSFLELGDQPLANSFLQSEADFETEPRFPLDVYFCSNCYLVQLADVIDPEILFRNYLYLTGTSATIAEHNIHYAQTVFDALALTERDRITEVASNDGSLLKCFRALGVRTLGVEPAQNIAKRANADGIHTLNLFFTESSAKQIVAEHGQSSAVIANNVLAHVDDPRGFLSGARTLLAAGGRVIVEVPYLGALLDKLEYDTVYHEHLCYFSVSALAQLCVSAGLSIERIDDLPIHGGTIRMFARPKSELSSHSDSVLARIADERARGLLSDACYRNLADQAAEQRERLRKLLMDLKARGCTVAGYGAPAKGNTLLNYCGVNRDLLPYIVDKSPLKVGLYTPGSHIPVQPVETLLEKQPDFVLILAWNFADEIMKQQAEYKRRGGAFIVPIPLPTVLA